jgi:hypothetical protein
VHNTHAHADLGQAAGGDGAGTFWWIIAVHFGS